MKSAAPCCRRHKGAWKEVDEYTFGDVHVDFMRQEATKGANPVKLSAKEFGVLKYFVQHEGEVVARNMLPDEIWGYEAYPATRTVDNYILSLRKKLKDDPAHPEHLLTAHPSEYKFK